MAILPLVGLCLAIVCLVLLIVVLVQLHSVRGALALFEQRLLKAQRASEDVGRFERTNSLLGNLMEQLKRIDDSVNVLRATSARSQQKQPSPSPAPLSKPAAPPQSVSAGAATSDSASSRSFNSPANRDTDVHEPVAPAWKPAKETAFASLGPVAPVADPDITTSDLLSEYRSLIAQPRKADINRWIEDHRGESCEALEDGAFRTLDRDAGGLLTLLPLNDEAAMILPAGRLVVDFATNFASSLSLRSVTRQTFEFAEDGSGVLRLIEPAFAARREGVWRLTKSGKLSGLMPG